MERRRKREEREGRMRKRVETPIEIALGVVILVSEKSFSNG
jgi:hypothetical protein